jgi:hypothetical protein
MKRLLARLPIGGAKIGRGPSDDRIRARYADVSFDLSYEAVLGAPSDFEAWAEAPRAYLRRRIVESPIVRLELRGNAEARAGDAAFEVFQFDAMQDGRKLPFSYDVDVFPRMADGAAPPLLFIHGHGLVAGESRGGIPRELYADPACYHGIGHALRGSGRRLIAVPNVVHAPLADAVGQHDYPVIWASLAHQALQALRREGAIPAMIDALGVAAGGHTLAALAAVDASVETIGVHGSFFPLDLLRRDYKLHDHPDCYDFRAFMSYTPIFALLCPRPFWLGIGREDALSLKMTGAPPAPGFSGLKRGANSDELLGGALVLESIWRKQGASVEICVNGGGHEDFPIHMYMEWLKAAAPRRAPRTETRST